MHEKLPSPTPLPIDPYLPSITATTKQNLIVTATAGSGKTTRLPWAIARLAKGKVLCVEPRRLACLAAATRVASELGECPGQNVGYHVRLDKRTRQNTKLTFLTTGMLLQYLCSDPFLEGIDAVIFDEFHERSLEADVALAMCRYLQRHADHPMRIILMSATLDAMAIEPYLTPCDIFDIDAPIFPLSIEYCSETPGTRPQDYVPHILKAIEKASLATKGDILIFLPGMAEIQFAIQAATPTWARDFDLVICHASLPLEAQNAILNPKTTKRRLIFSTNIAESSLTIPRVCAVIDTGLAKEKFFDSTLGLSRLETVRISRASADQRAGRAARLAQGVCHRLWTTHTHAQLEHDTRPQIERLDLAQPILQIHAWQLEAPQALPFLSAPAQGRIHDAQMLLRQLGALDGNKLTPIGQHMAKLPLEPRLARWLIEAANYDCLEETAWLAAYLSEAPYRRQARDLFPGPDLDVDRSILQKSKRLPEFACLAKIAKDLLETARSLLPAPTYIPTASPQEAIAKSMLSAYPDRLAQPRPSREKNLTDSDPKRLTRPIYARMTPNRGVVIPQPQTLHDARFLLCIDLDLAPHVKHAANAVQKAIAIDPKWIPWQEGLKARYEPDKDRVVVAMCTFFDVFTLRETFLHDDSYDDIACQTLLEAALQNPQKALNFDTPDLVQLIARMAFTQTHRPELDFPCIDDNFAKKILPKIIRQHRSFSALQEIDLAHIVTQRLSPEAAAALQTIAPTHITLQNGRRTTVDYTLSSPVIRVKIQDAFGTFQIPHVANGKIPVLVHLCAPNGRPAQLTQDLDSFWRNTYKDVRKLLRGRYPKHDWPENPPGV